MGPLSGSFRFRPARKSLQPPAEITDVVAVIRGVIEADDSAIAHYNSLIDLCGRAHDYVTQDLAITQLGDEEGHRTMFIGFLKECSGG